MTDKIIENNQVEIMGKIASRFTFSHQVFGEGFYMVDVLVKRLSDSEDRIPVMISERLVDVNEDYEGEYIHVMGQFTVKPLTFRMEKSANYPYHLLRMIYSFYIYAGTASFGGSHPNAFNFFKYAWIFRSALN